MRISWLRNHRDLELRRLQVDAKTSSKVRKLDGRDATVIKYRFDRVRGIPVTVEPRPPEVGYKTHL